MESPSASTPSRRTPASARPTALSARRRNVKASSLQFTAGDDSDAESTATTNMTMENSVDTYQASLPPQLLFSGDLDFHRRSAPLSPVAPRAAAAAAGILTSPLHRPHDYRSHCVRGPPQPHLPAPAPGARPGRIRRPLVSRALSSGGKHSSQPAKRPAPQAAPVPDAGRGRATI